MRRLKIYQGVWCPCFDEAGLRPLQACQKCRYKINVGPKQVTCSWLWHGPGTVHTGP